ncbi:hypothetical protein [Arthrobacter rhombi]|uniref:Lipoprotein n=1 Tax=Arthrobacter rhombi TaxID=71253 RepID=A0A1R4FK81_9MICC|nr:hypothetical protein [Arthrobacter rhombi]SJM56308.1 hypothetical protein FM101_04375 [Arthrobacter rhombi]
MIGRHAVRPGIAVCAAATLFVGVGLSGCTSSAESSAATSTAASNQQGLEYEADLGTMYAGVPVLFNPAELSGGAAVDDHERLEFDAGQEMPKGLEIATPGVAELPRLCEGAEPCRDGEAPKFAPEEAVVAMASEGYDGAPFTLTGQAIDADGHTSDVSMVITPASVEKAPGSTALPGVNSITAESGDSKLTIDFSEAMMVNHAGGKSYVTGTYQAEFPAMAVPPDGVLDSTHAGDFTADEIFSHVVDQKKPQLSGERGVLAVLIDDTAGGVTYSLPAGAVLSFPYADVVDSLPHTTGH